MPQTAEVTLKLSIPGGVTESEIRQWLEFHLGNRGLPVEHRMVDVDLEGKIQSIDVYPAPCQVLPFNSASRIRADLHTYRDGDDRA